MPRVTFLITKQLRLISFSFNYLKGINLRYMGALRQHLTKPRLRNIILAHAVARLLKSILCSKMRDLVRSTKSEMACKRLVASFITDMLFAGRSSPSTWNDVDLQKDVMRKYPGILSEEEQAVPFAPPLFCPRLTVCECLHLNLMKLSTRATKVLFSTTNFNEIEVLDSDIVELCCTTQYPLLVHISRSLIFVLVTLLTKSQYSVQSV